MDYPTLSNNIVTYGTLFYVRYFLNDDIIKKGYFHN